MKKSLIALLTATLLITMMIGLCSCYNGTNNTSGSEGLEYEMNEDETYSVVGIGTCSDADIIIPSTYQGLAVTQIGEYAFLQCTGIKSVYIPESIVEIGAGAFEACVELTSIKSSNMGSSQNESACLTNEKEIDTVVPLGFSYTNNSHIEDGDIARTKTIGERSFFGCENLIEVSIPNGMNKIENDAFSSCAKLKKIIIPNSITHIRARAFTYCAELTEIIIPNGVVSIGEEAFSGCHKAQRIDIPGSVEYIGAGAFSNCHKVKQITIPDSVSIIGDHAFLGCWNLRSLKLGSGVESIGNEAFLDCFRLVEVIDNSKLNIKIGSGENGLIGYHAKSVHTGSSLIKTQDEYLFMSNAGINYLIGYLGNDTHVNLPESYNGEDYKIAASAFRENKSIVTLNIPNGVTEIETYAFFNCIQLASVALPQSMEIIGYNAFTNCYSLVEIINQSELNLACGSWDNGEISLYAKSVHKSESKIDNVDDYIFISENGINYLVEYIGNNTDLVLPESYKGESYQINDRAFAHRKQLTSIVVPDNVTSIGESTFLECYSLREVVIGNGVTDIGNSFMNCERLVSVSLGECVKSIGEYSFSGCYQLVEVINKSNLQLEKGKNGLVADHAKEIHSGESKIVNIGDYLFITSNGTNYLVSYIGTSSVIALPDNYNGQSYVINSYAIFPKQTYELVIDEKQLILSKGVDTFLENALYNVSVAGVHVDDIATLCRLSLQSGVFGGGNLYLRGKLVKDLIIPNGVTEIKNYTFAGFRSIRSVIIPDSVQSIGENAFVACKGLIKVKVGNGVTTIGRKAFSSCTNLASVELGKNVSSIGNSAFTKDVIEVINHSSLMIEKKSDDHGYIGYGAKIIHTGASKLTRTGDYIFITYERYENQNVNLLIAYTGRASNLILPENYNGEKYEIWNSAFAGNKSIEQIQIPDSVTSIGSDAFDGCSALRYVNMGDGVTSIGKFAFEGCFDLNKIVMSESISTIGRGAFIYCSSLEYVYHKLAEEQWRRVYIDELNDFLIEAEHYYSCD